MLLCGIASIFGAETVTVSGKPVTGIMGFVEAMIMYPIACILFSSMAWIFSTFGLWVYSFFKNIELELIDAEVIEVVSTPIKAEETDV